MLVTCLVVLALSDASGAAPQRLASHTSHILTFVSPLAFERTRTQTAGRAHLHTNGTLLHLAQILLLSHARPTFHVDAHEPLPALGRASILYNPLGPAAHPARVRHCLQQAHKPCSATHAANWQLLALGTRTHGAPHACSTRHSHSSRTSPSMHPNPLTRERNQSPPRSVKSPSSREQQQSSSERTSPNRLNPSQPVTTRLNPSQPVPIRLTSVSTYGLILSHSSHPCLTRTPSLHT